MDNFNDENSTMYAVPFDIEAEYAVDAAIMYEPNLYGVAAEILEPNDFYDSGAGLLFKVLERYAAKVKVSGGEADAILLKTLLEESGARDADAIFKEALRLNDFIADAESIKVYASKVKDRAKRRRLMEICRYGLKIVSDFTKPIGEIEDEMLAALFAADTKGYSEGIGSGDLAGELCQMIEERQKSGSTLAGMSTGYTSLDTFLGGFEKQKLYVLGARPAMGKTSLMLMWAANLAMRGHTVAVFSYEMSSLEIIQRIYSAVCGIDGYKFRKANLSDEDWVSMAETVNALENRIVVFEAGGKTAEGVMSSVLRYNAKHRDSGIEAVFIDYLGLMAGAEGRWDLRAAVEKNSRACKLMAMELNVPVILLSQLSRECEKREDKRPMLSDLRESGAIEQDADCVMGLYREAVYNESAPETEAELIILKQRCGRTGKIPLIWTPSRTGFSSK